MDEEKPAIGLIELTSVARGVVSCDQMVKKAPVKLIRSHPICPGKYIILITGLVGPVEESIKIGKYYAGHTLVDELIIENIHPYVIPAINATTDVKKLLSVGIIETFSVASCIIAADKACKAAEIQLIEMRLGTGLGGKAYVTLTGQQHMVEAALSAGVSSIKSGLLVKWEIIPAPHDDMDRVML